MIYFLYILIGVSAGFFAGMFGIGGGGYIVPLLVTVFAMQSEFPVHDLMHYALATTIVSIVFAAFSSMRAHHKKGGVNWPIFKQMFPFMMIGTFGGTFLVREISAVYLTIFFALFILLIAYQMYFDNLSYPAKLPLNKKEFSIVGVFIGFISSLVSIGGGSLTVPYLKSRAIDLRVAIGTSAALGFCIACAGSLGYLIQGISEPIRNACLGLINIPAAFLIAFSSYLSAPWGVRMAYRIETKTLRKMFAILLLALSLKMLWMFLI